MAAADACASGKPLQEVGILKSLNYDRNIVQFYGACLQEGSDPMLVCEFMEGGCCTPGLAAQQPHGCVCASLSWRVHA